MANPRRGMSKGPGEAKSSYHLNVQRIVKDGGREIDGGGSALKEQKGIERNVFRKAGRC